MYDIRPVASVIGRLTAVLGATMILAAMIDAYSGHENWRGTGFAAFLTLTASSAVVLVTRSAIEERLSRQQAFLLTTLVWVVLPVFGALPFLYGPADTPYRLDFTDAYFEAVSGLTTTGATVMSQLDTAPPGLLFWRAVLQWYGGVGIVVFAMVFLPAMKIGGMQFFRSESFDIGTDILPRAAEVAGQLFWIYLALTVGCVLAYSATGMEAFDAICHAMTTVSTGGLGNYDTSFAGFSAGAQYVAVLFMMLAALPFIRFIELSRGRARPIVRDRQVQGFLGVVLVVSGLVMLWLLFEGRTDVEAAFRASLFNITSITTGTGYASAPYDSWGGLPIALFFTVALIGGCAGSTSCSAKVFRYQILFAALIQQIRRIHSPSGIFPLRYDNRAVEPEVLSSVMAFFFVFVTALSVWAILLSMFGLPAITAISGAVAVLANVGPGLGTQIGPSGNYADLPEGAKWICSMGMLLGRLEFISVLVLLTPSFWRR
ncbi:TrkH family potassium uptake protein [Paralimibaculum aggregatum]|uniref:Trk system potassium uptake protein n=1 Tax=Paralimibaculum aggregatum TaxID=3036245 RepID=A0ABQ6LJB5_9RHOB|nr:TrkH family potassium uptake protein [Limibaculum sp. NKW23]GMG83358.1 TrkH family potassium uptake protein [Limibaculum sp. NKW23]